MLENATQCASNTPLVITLFGDAGSGKTSLACEFPDAFMIRTKGEGPPRDVTHVPTALPPVGGQMTKVGEAAIWDEAELFDQLKALVSESHQFKTLIIDSVSGIEELFVQNILDVQPAKQRTMNAALNGYGSAWDVVAAKHSRLRKAAEVLRDRRGMSTVFICHADVQRMEPPDAEPYMRYALQLHKKTAPIYTNQSDVVGFVHQRMFTSGDGDVKKAKTTGERVVTVDLTPANVSKNRLGISGDLTYNKGTNPFEEYMG